MQSAPYMESTGTMLMHPRLRLRYGRAWLTKRQGECPRGIVLVSKRAILPMVKIGRVGVTVKILALYQLRCEIGECSRSLAATETTTEIRYDKYTLDSSKRSQSSTSTL